MLNVAVRGVEGSGALRMTFGFLKRGAFRKWLDLFTLSDVANGTNAHVDTFCDDGIRHSSEKWEHFSLPAFQLLVMVVQIQGAEHCLKCPIVDDGRSVRSCVVSCDFRWRTMGHAFEKISGLYATVEWDLDLSCRLKTDESRLEPMPAFNA